MTELWRPSPERIANANLTRFIECLNARRGTRISGYPELYEWSIAHPGEFWSELARFADVRADWGEGPAIEHPDRMPGARFFPAARLNFAENLLRYRDDQPAIIFRNERGLRRTLSYRELHAEVARVAAGLAAAGVSQGDRVAGYLPNLPETAIAMLAAASLGAIWSSCSPAVGFSGVLDRFGRIAWMVLLTADGYVDGGQCIDSSGPVAQVLAKLPRGERVVVVPYLSEQPDITPLGGKAVL